MTIGKDIGEIVNSELKSKGLKPKYLASKIYPDLGFGSESSAYDFMLRVINGYTYYSLKPFIVRRTSDRLAKLFNAIGIENHPIFARIREDIDPEFSYPPENSISYQEIMQAAQVAKKDKTPISYRDKFYLRMVQLSRLLPI